VAGSSGAREEVSQDVSAITEDSGDFFMVRFMAA
jgi:hypothetical protein